jgi:hypothetical protein
VKNFGAHSRACAWCGANHLWLTGLDSSARVEDFLLPPLDSVGSSRVFVSTHPAHRTRLRGAFPELRAAGHPSGCAPALVIGTDWFTRRNSLLPLPRVRG